MITEVLSTRVLEASVTWMMVGLSWHLNQSRSHCVFWIMNFRVAFSDTKFGWNAYVLACMTTNPSALVWCSQSLFMCSIKAKQKYRGDSTCCGHKSSSVASTIVAGRQAIWKERWKAESSKSSPRKYPIDAESRLIPKESIVARSDSSFHFNAPCAQNAYWVAQLFRSLVQKLERDSASPP